MIDLKLPGYLQGISFDFYMHYLSILLNAPNFRLIFGVMSYRNEIREDLLSGEWKSLEEQHWEYLEDSIDIGQNSIVVKHYIGVI